MKNTQKTKILLISNDRKLFQSFHSLFSKTEYLVKHVPHIYGMKESLTNKYQIVVIDYQENLCFDLFKNIKLFKNTGSKSHIILLIDTLNSEDEIKAYKEGIDLCHRKPINLELLETQIEKILSFEIPNEEIHLKDIIIKPKERRLIRDDKEIYLTRTEYDFLLLLIKENGRVLTRNQITRQIMNYNHDVSLCAVDTMISRTRKKLDKNKKEVIETVQCKGYRLSSFYIEKKSFC